MDYDTRGVCSRSINFDVVNGKVRNVKFVGGCRGNLEAICRLVEGMDVDWVIDRIKGIKCGYKKTSCPDQLAAALEGYESK